MSILLFWTPRESSLIPDFELKFPKRTRRGHQHKPLSWSSITVDGKESIAPVTGQLTNSKTGSSYRKKGRPIPTLKTDTDQALIQTCFKQVISCNFYLHHPTAEAKGAAITPMPNISAPKEHADFRPISITPVLTRISEGIIVNQFIYPAIFTPQQLYHLKISTHSAQLALQLHSNNIFLTVLHTVTNVLTTNPYVIVLSLDFSKAFDTVRHATFCFLLCLILSCFCLYYSVLFCTTSQDEYSCSMKKLAQLNLPDSVYNWLTEFLAATYTLQYFTFLSTFLPKIIKIGWCRSKQGCGLGLDVSVSRRSWDVLTSRLGLVRQTSRSRPFTSRAQDQFSAKLCRPH